MKEGKITYIEKHPDNFKQVLLLFESLGWNTLNLSVEELEKMCKQSWYTIYAYDDKQLIGMGRVISDGVITGIICGLGVLPEYQSKGIGKEMLNRLVIHCEKNRVIPQLMCLDSLETYYNHFGFKRFSVGMTRNISR